MSLTSKERLMRIFANKPIDRPAIKLWGSWNYRKGDKLLHPSYEPAMIKAAEKTDLVVNASTPFFMFCGQVDIVRRKNVEINDPLWYEEHIVFHTPMGQLRRVDRISKIGEPGFTIEYPVKQPEDIKRMLSMPYEPFPYVDNIEEQQQLLGDRGIVLYRIDHIAYALYRMIGSENLAYFTHDCRDLLMEALDVFSKRLYAHVEEALNNGVRVPFSWVGPELLIPPLLSEKDFMDFCFDYDKHICDMVHNAGSYIWVHCHGKVRNLIEKFIEMGVDVLNPLEPPKNGDVDLDEVARTFKNRIGLEGNIEMQDFYDESEEVIREKIKTCVQSGKQSNRFIMCTSAGFMDFPTPSKQYLDNIMTYIDYGYECVNNARY